MATKAIELINQERREQIEKHGHSLIDDSMYNGNAELAAAAGALIWNDRDLLPNDWASSVVQKMFAKPRRERLVIAGALIAAEIDRMIYNEEQEFPAVSPSEGPSEQ